MSQRVLIVDDDPMIRHILQVMLEAEGYSVTAAENGSLGLEKVAQTEATKEPFSLIVVDMMMPEMNGLDLLRHVRKRSLYQKTPVLMLSAESRPENMMSGYAAGASYYLTKPFSRNDLIQGIRFAASQRDE